MDVNETREGKVLVLDLIGRLDAASSPEMETRLAAAVQETPALVLDLSGMEYVSSAGLRVLLKTAKEAKAGGVGLALAALRPTVTEVFQISGFFTILNAYPTREQAVAAVG